LKNAFIEEGLGLALFQSIGRQDVAKPQKERAFLLHFQPAEKYRNKEEAKEH